MLKDYRFTVQTKHATGRLVTIESGNKPRIEVATPPEFRDGIADVWSPEDLLVAATSTCYALTLSAIAERRSIPIGDLSVFGVGHVSRRADNIFGFIVVELAVEITTEEGHETDVEHVAELARHGCIVNDALKVPIEVELKIRTRQPAAPALV
ncbi:MAG TPA: OsmC family protein [Gaiellaceae bacterium]|nr:OsmC family protein [Gaiellaceae bacterium]